MTKIFNTISEFICGCFTGQLLAQDTSSREAWIDEMFEFAYGKADLTSEETTWVKKMLDEACTCNYVEDETRGRRCINTVMKKEGLPVEDAEFDTMTPEQIRKFMLLSPLMNMVGDCPE